ncbi:MAG: helix-turn-helix transcriptional regulator [Butyrivibrio sp.]|nr:helix-turn-helix transcriptional regulator [Butyrivibrio sp.]
MENRVEKLRKERGMNQEEFAKAIRVSRQTVSSIETGKYNPSLELAFTIADFFGKTIEEVFIHEVSSADGKENIY